MVRLKLLWQSPCLRLGWRQIVAHGSKFYKSSLIFFPSHSIVLIATPMLLLLRKNILNSEIFFNRQAGPNHHQRSVAQTNSVWPANGWRGSVTVAARTCHKSPRPSDLSSDRPRLLGSHRCGPERPAGKVWGMAVMLSRAFVTCIGRAVAIVVIAAFPFQKSATATELLKNCSPLASQIGAENVWFGHACGRSSSTANPWAEMGCFSTEADCRNWLLKSVPGSKPTSLLSCRQGAPKWSLRSQTD